MTLLFIDGFDHHAGDADTMTSKWSAVDATSYGTTTSIARTGTRSFALYDGYIQKNIIPTGTVIVGFAFRLPTLSIECPILALMDSSSFQCHLQVTTSGTINLYRGSNTSNLIVSGTKSLTKNNWYYIEFQIVIASVNSASYQLNINGIVEFSGSADLIATSNATINGIRFRSYTSGGLSCYYDDVYICDGGGSTNNTFLGSVKVATLYPDGDSAVTWTKSQGASNYVNVNELVPDNDATFVYTSSDGNQDLYTMGNTPFGGTIYGVQLNVCARKDDTNTHSLSLKSKLSSTTVSSSLFEVTNSFTVFSNLWENDPSAGNSWSISDLNNALFGMELESSP